MRFMIFSGITRIKEKVLSWRTNSKVHFIRVQSLRNLVPEFWYITPTIWFVKRRTGKTLVFCWLCWNIVLIDVDLDPNEED